MRQFLINLLTPLSVKIEIQDATRAGASNGSLYGFMSENNADACPVEVYYSNSYVSGQAQAAYHIAFYNTIQEGQDFYRQTQEGSSRLTNVS